MKFYVPSIGHQIRLTDDWEFPLFTEGRNDSLLTRLQPGLTYSYGDTRSILAVLEKGTVLQVDRIYIRKGKSEWDSITFWVKFAPNDKERAKVSKSGGRRWHHQPEEDTSVSDRQQKFKGARFWAKLEDVNEIVFEPISNSGKVK